MERNVFAICVVFLVINVAQVSLSIRATLKHRYKARDHTDTKLPIGIRQSPPVAQVKNVTNDTSVINKSYVLQRHISLSDVVRNATAKITAKRLNKPIAYKQVKSTVSTIKTTMSTIKRRSKRLITQIKPEENISETVSVKTLPLPVAKIIGGTNTNAGEWPWQALIRVGSSGFCGGVLVHSCYVLTARHCTNVDKSQLTVTLGEHDRTLNEGSEQVRTVLHIFQHPTFDAALLLLDTAVTLNTFVNTINFASFVPTVGTQVTVTGWGWLNSGVSSPSNILQELQLPIADWNLCAAQLSPFLTLNSNDVCAGDPAGPYANACHGDSGGPLVWFNGSQWTLIGIVNRGAPGCPTTVDYAVYLSIPSISVWISSLLPSVTTQGGASCNCLQPVIRHDGALIQATYDGANCFIGPAKTGCGESNPSNKAFIHQNRYYETSSKAIECPLGSWDTCNCYYRSVSNLPAGVNDFIYQNRFYVTDNPYGVCYIGSFDTQNCLVESAPWGTTAFKYNGVWYTTAKPTCNFPFSYDGANCQWMSIPSGGFIWSNNYYVTSGPGNTCNIGIFDGENCYIRSAPWATTAFAHNGRWYHTPRRQCDDGQFDGANCLMMYPPIGAVAFIWQNKQYYGWL